MARVTTSRFLTPKRSEKVSLTYLLALVQNPAEMHEKLLRQSKLNLLFLLWLLAW